MNRESIELGEVIRVRKPPEDEEGPFRVSELPRDFEKIDQAVEMVSDANGDLCIAMRNVGATPWFRPTPYDNHRGVTVNMWSCISVYPKRAPGKTLLSGRRKPIWPNESGEYNVNIFTKEWVRAELRKTTGFEVHPAEKSPFLTDWYDWNWENRDGR